MRGNSIVPCAVRAGGHAALSYRSCRTWLDYEYLSSDSVFALLRAARLIAFCTAYCKTDIEMGTPFFALAALMFAAHIVKD